ncbi:sugar phosphate isomerase/epimerase [Cryobacterium glaciale]|uniref:Sugar phosphate isomerase/epimerase n=1 Tax=Cryobacterium glaciale TaxID=1259145 RepID=A0A4R8V0M3_9MICO|nr:sugar phosphate isomerase/epimerase [Cryobacterium glaciale]TFB74351.1 sugar phosphate isomerase/epimerase [Cryobacterium glaciale]
MKLAVSNIAWDMDEESTVANSLQSLNVRYVEIAPTKVFANPTSTSAIERSDYLHFWRNHGISIVAFQSMLFGRPDLQLFESESIRSEMRETLSRFIELAGALGVGKLVFGSPKNRVIPPAMDPRTAHDIAAAFFARLAQTAVDNDTCFCIEPNPEDYGCNFVTTAAQGLTLVKAVGHPGFRLHLDAAGMALAGDAPAESIKSAGELLAHFHASAPYLGPLEATQVNHRQAALGLREIGYAGNISIEMRPGNPGTAISAIGSAVALTREFYSAS